jgi:DNA-binding response OmpR family regulator
LIVVAYLLDHDADEAAVLMVVLQRAGFSPRSARDLDRVLQVWNDQPAEMVVVAIKRGLLASQVGPQISQIRAQSEVPVILVTDLLDEDIQIGLYEAGVDLIVTRPYSARLLIAQVKALMRRTGGLPFFSMPVMTLRDLVLDPSAHTIKVADRPAVRLTQLEFRLMYTLMIHPGQVIPSETLVEHVWGFNGQGDRDLVRGLIRRLRAKVEPDPQVPEYIQTVPGVGYVFQT